MRVYTDRTEGDGGGTCRWHGPTTVRGLTVETVEKVEEVLGPTPHSTPPPSSRPIRSPK